MTEIKFGTDGWRGIIADDYTFDNVRIVSQAVAEYMKRHALAGRGIAIGYDTRFLSGSFAGAVAEVMAGNDIKVWLSDGFVPTPALSLAVREHHAGAGVMITASHNPARWNGFKIKPDYGGSAPTEVTAEIEQAIPGIAASGRIQHMALGEAEARNLVDRVDIRTDYIRALREFVDMNAIRGAGLSVLVDSMYGASQGIFADVIGDGATRLHEVHGVRNPSFPGIRAPEPIAANLGEASALMNQGGFDIGLATDGDGDRFGLLDENGRFITQLQTFALLVHYYLEVRGERGPIVRSVTMTRMVDRLGERFECPVYETPVGFKFLGAKMMETDAMVAGEESGGFAYRGHIPERDGALTGLFFLDWIARTGKRPAELLSDLYAVVGPHEYHRVDITLRPEEQFTVRERLGAAEPKEIAGLRVEGRDQVDGFRFNLAGGWWLLLRFSGTEPLLRIYAEMPSMEQVHEALQAGQELAGVSL
ncbi:MAG: phosphoglucomutase/phosphomannomutase family protein [Dehalococcoidia bacterium]